MVKGAKMGSDFSENTDCRDLVQAAVLAAADCIEHGPRDIQVLYHIAEMAHPTEGESLGVSVRVGSRWVFCFDDHAGAPWLVFCAGPHRMYAQGLHPSTDIKRIKALLKEALLDSSETCWQPTQH
jgi:hypothetical protein